MIKAIIFDLGGVIVDTKLVVDRIARVFDIHDKKKFWQDMNHEMIPLCKGDINERQFWTKIASKYNMEQKSVPKNFFRKDFEKLIRLNRELLQLIDKLKDKYKVAVISNIIEYHSKINKSMGLYEPFDHVVLSYKVKLTKDSKEIFMLTTKRLKVNPEECIFIDDVKKFVRMAKSIGMKTILFKNNKQLKSDLKKLLK